MGTNAGKRAKLGIFVIAASVLMMATIYFIGQKQHLFGGAFFISGDFTDVSGLRVGNNVRFAGVNVGSVEAVTITSKSTVRVDMLISETVRRFIKKDAEASVGTESMMGNKVVVLAPGTDEGTPVADHDVIRTTIPINYDDILKQLKHTTENAAIITDNLAHLTGSMSAGQGILGKMFMDKGFSREVSATLVSLKNGSDGFRDLVESAQESWLLWGSGKKREEKKEAKREKDAKAEQFEAARALAP